MNTPIYDYVTSYVEQNPHRMHMPGHKGAPYLGCEIRDITEITGADALYEADGIIMESEGYAAELFGSGRTLYSTEGSTQCIKGMLYLALQLAAPCEKPVILAGRNAHKAFLYGCALLDLTVSWLYPEDGAHSICSCPITAKDVETALKNADTKPVAVYLTTPDYLGGMVDVAAVARVCRRYAVPLLVDNAHGAYLKFLQPSLHPMDLGADLCCDSAHKTLPVLTGGAYLHLSHDAASKVGHIAKTAMGIFGSTSPSYLTLQSLDLCNRYLSDGYQNKLKQTICAIDDAKAKLSAMGYTVLPSDPLKIVIDASSYGVTGKELAAHLYRHGIYSEFSDDVHLVLMLTPDNPTKDLDALNGALAGYKKGQAKAKPVTAPIPHGLQAVSIRTALMGKSRWVTPQNAVGCICAAPTVACPPAVPIAVCGETITQEMADLFCAYGIDEILILAE